MTNSNVEVHHLKLDKFLVAFGSLLEGLWTTGLYATGVMCFPTICALRLQHSKIFSD
jgi:hypothetical protein